MLMFHFSFMLICLTWFLFERIQLDVTPIERLSKSSNKAKKLLKRELLSL